MSFERFLNERLPDALRDPPPDADPEVVKAARQYHRGKAAHDYLIGEAQARARYAALPEVVSPQLRDAASRALSTMAAANVHMDGTFESILNSAASGAWPAASGTKPIRNDWASVCASMASVLTFAYEIALRYFAWARTTTMPSERSKSHNQRRTLF